MVDSANASVAAQALEALRTRGLFLVTAESLTGGSLAASFVEIPGASDVFLGGLIAYQTPLKSKWLGVDTQLLAANGAVDAEVAEQMAEGARNKVAKDLTLEPDRVAAIATTGVAGPLEQDGKSVGVTFIAVAQAGHTAVFEYLFSGDRNQIRTQAVAQAVLNLREEISKN